MSYIGKILVVLQLVLSICLMAFAGAVSSIQTNWKKVADDTKTQLTKAQSDASTAAQTHKTDTDKFTAELNLEKEKGRELAAKVSQLTLQVSNLAGEVKRDAEKLAQGTQINTDLAEDSSARQNEVKIVREKLKSSLEDRDAQYIAKAALEDKIFEQNTRIDRLTVQNKQLLLDNKNFKEVLIARGLPMEIEEYQKGKTPPPKVEGEVLLTRKPKEGSQLFEISVGENDGLSVGNEVFVYRSAGGGKYLGKATIMEINADTAVCAMAPRSNLVEKGDHVATKLN